MIPAGTQGQQDNLEDIDVASEQSKVDAAGAGYAVIVNKARKAYKLKKKKVNVALSDLSLAIKEGEFFGLIGPNGAGN